MNVGETIFRRMEQVNFFLKVSLLPIRGNCDRIKFKKAEWKYYLSLHTNAGVDRLESPSFIKLYQEILVLRFGGRK